MAVMGEKMSWAGSGLLSSISAAHCPPVTDGPNTNTDTAGVITSYWGYNHGIHAYIIGRVDDQKMDEHF